MPSRHRFRLPTVVVLAPLLITGCADGNGRPELLFDDVDRAAPTGPSSDPPTTMVGDQTLGVIECVDDGCQVIAFDGSRYRRGDWPLSANGERALGPTIALGPELGGEVRRPYLVREVAAFRPWTDAPWEVIVYEDAEASRAIVRLACGAIEPAANDIIADCGEALGSRVVNESGWEERERAVLDAGCDELPELLVDAVSSGDGAAGTADDVDVESLVALVDARWLAAGCEGHLGLTSGVEQPDLLRP